MLCYIVPYCATGVVTAFLIFTVYCYSWRKLWRGPHWVDALAQVRQIKKLQLLQEQQGKDQDSQGQPGTASTATTAAANAGSTSAGTIPAAAAAAAGNGAMTAGMAAGMAAVAAGEAIAVDCRQGSSSAGVRQQPAPNGPAASSDGTAVAVQAGEGGDAGVQPTFWAKLRAKLPWFWGPAEGAITNTSDCNSFNQYRQWRVPLIVLCAVLTFPVGIFGCALGLPGGQVMSQMLLALGLKPRVVAGTSRFLVLCFMFGSIVAHVIGGSLKGSSAATAAFGLVNLGLAPLGMLLFCKFKPRGLLVLYMSLFMGLAGFVIITIGQLVPLVAEVLGRYGVAVGKLAPGHGVLPSGTAASVGGWSNAFDPSRFCYTGHH